LLEFSPYAVGKTASKFRLTVEDLDARVKYIWPTEHLEQLRKREKVVEGM
jgi:hypothetical protein